MLYSSNYPSDNYDKLKTVLEQVVSCVCVCNLTDYTVVYLVVMHYCSSNDMSVVFIRTSEYFKHQVSLAFTAALDMLPFI